MFDTRLDINLELQSTDFFVDKNFHETHFVGNSNLLKTSIIMSTKIVSGSNKF